ncbi:TonB-dependent receptor [Gracilimonas mengyeensis]|uniref:TonB-dependent Receptor Plug Domain n=1 Tax=Gracilimonas mengyeensis TaxID=1302730 RepID=A0A521FNQ5_9BACT|nr:TonB-dependent receptor [Gracilimonas mengyeensis]SMO97769.1 TonB-dependent Receptor Plug Domain [Gracilimonas mengyeensis]
MLRTLLFGLILTIPSMLLAQENERASVSGYITDSETGETLISANIALIEINKGMASNTLGYYSLTNVQPGTYTLICSYVGYQQFRQEVTLEAGQNLRLDVELQPESLELDEIEVRSRAEEEEQKNIGRQQIKTEMIKELPSVFEADVFRSIQQLPGVKAASDFSSGLYIRGGSPDQTLILLDRTTVYNPSHFFGFFSTFNPDAIKDVRLYKGGYPAEFGGRLGSVLTIYNKDGNRNETAGSVTAGMLASRVSVEGPYSKGSWMFAARRSTLEPLLAGLRQTTDNVPSKFYFYDFNGKVNFDATDSDKFSLAFYAGQDRVTFPFGDDAEFGLDYGNQTLSGNWTHIFSERLFSNFVFTGSRYFNFPNFELGGTEFTRTNNIYDFSIKADLEYLPGNNHLIKTGIWAGNFTFKFKDTFDGSETFSSRIQNQYASFYVQDEWTPNERWIFTPGIRFNYFSDGDFFRVEPRFSLEYRPADRIRLQAAYGRYNQFLTLISNEAFSGFDIWLTSAEGVDPAFGDQFVLGAKTIPFEGYGLDVELYYRSMEDLFELDPFLPDVAGLLYEDMFRFGTGYAYGAEVFFERRMGRFTGFIGYTLGYTWRKFPGFNYEIGNEEQAARFYPPKYDRRHDINVVANYQLSNRWKATASFNFATGQAYTQVLGRYIQHDLPVTNENRNVFTVGKVNASRLPNYHRMDVSFARKGTFFGMGDAEWQFQLINVYSRRNVWFYSFDFDENPVERNDVTLLPILPSISYTVNF